jgi:hypothetical protein
MPETFVRRLFPLRLFLTKILRTLLRIGLFVSVTVIGMVALLSFSGSTKETRHARYRFSRIAWRPARNHGEGPQTFSCRLRLNRRGIGKPPAPSLASGWRLRSRRVSQKAFYYARVLEIPTPRWTAYDRVKFDLDLPESVSLKQQERAYTSPIWYSPKG